MAPARLCWLADARFRSVDSAEFTAGHMIEVDLTRQLLLIVTDGHLDAALNTSTGGGYVYYDQGSRQAGARNDVAEAEGEKCCAAKINVSEEAGLAAGHNHGGARSILHEAKTQNEADGPNAHENQERERTVKAQK